MRALRKERPEPGAELAEVPLPEAGPGEVLLRVAAASICGTDIHIYRWNEWAARRLHPPVTFGHEVAGEVVATGPEVHHVPVGAFVSARAYRAYFLKELQRELREMRELPDVEREEIREVYRGRGFRGETLEMVVDTITSDPKVWLRVMMQEELGLSQGFGQPLGAALTVFVAFLIGGTVPVIPFVFGSGVAALSVSFVVTAAALVVAGAIRTRFTGERPARAGLELVAMATVGVAVAYGIGRLLHVAGVG